MISEDLMKRLLSAMGNNGIKRDVEELKTFRDAVNAFDGFGKFDTYWVLDGLYGMEQDCLDLAKEYHALYEELNRLRHEKWGDDCEPTGDTND